MSQDTSLGLDELLRQVAEAPPAPLPYPASWLRLGPGRRLGPYRIVERLGTGGMGVVFHAVDERLERPVALKLLRNTEGRDLATWREGQSAAAVGHANIATVYEVNEIDGIPFLALELVEGSTLRQWLRIDRPASERLAVARQLVSAVAGLHEVGLVHRDLKPDNVMVDQRGRVKLLDFGLATRSSAATDGVVLGTAPYMAPEQAQGAAVDARADVYSLGVVLDHMSEGSPRAQRSLRKLTCRCQQEDPSQRPANAGTLLQQWEQAASRRRWGLAAAVAVALVGTAAGGWAAFTPAESAVVTTEAPVAAPHTRVSARFAEQRINSVLINPQGTKIAHSDGKDVLVYDVATGRTRRQAAPAERRVALLEWSSQGELLAWGLDPKTSKSELFRSSKDAVWRSLHPEDLYESMAVDGALSKVGHVINGRLSVTSLGRDFETISSVAVPAGDIVCHLRWSPDGSKLAFIRHQTSQRGTVSSIEVLEDGELRVLFESSKIAQGHGSGTFSWLNDAQVVFALTEAGSEPGVSLWSIAVSADAEPARHAQWSGRVIGQLSFGGGKLAYLRYTSQEDVWLADVADAKLQNIRRLTQSEFDERLSSWSSDGRELLIMSNQNGKLGAYRLGLEDGLPEAVLNSDARSTWPVASEAGVLVWQKQGTKSVLQRVVEPSKQDTFRSVADDWSGVGRPPPRDISVQCVEGLCVMADKEPGLLRFRSLNPSTGSTKHLGTVAYAGSNAFRFSLSPSGDRLAVIHKGNILRVVQMSTMAFTDTKLPGEFNYQAVDWGCQGTDLVLSGFGAGELPFQIIHYDLSGTHHILHQGAGTWWLRPQWSPNCRQLAFTGHELDSDVWLTQLPGTLQVLMPSTL